MSEAVLSAFVTNLGKYNEGILAGEWLKLPTDTATVQALFSRIGMDGVRYEEFFITDYPGNVLSFQTVAHTVHPTQKPVDLCEYLIKTYTREGAVVADICAGSGTTAVAALNTGRRFVCFENAPVFYGPATERVEQARLAVASGGKGV